MSHAPNRGSDHRRVAWELGFLALCVCVAAGAPKDRGASPAPDGVCYPVNGTGYMVAREDGLRVPIGTLSPLLEGDSLIVLTGSITFIDFRTGQSPIYGAGTRLVIPPVQGHPQRPLWLDSLVSEVGPGLTQTQDDRIGGAVRGGGPSLWPDGARFAPGIPIVFEWDDVRPPATALRVCAGRDTTVCNLPEGSSAQGAYAWRPEALTAAGSMSWALLDDRGEPLAYGTFVLLTAEEAEAEREHYRRAAAGADPARPEGLTAVLLARVDRAYLW